MARGQLIAYRVWDLPTRLFHLVTGVCVLALILLGTLILYARDLGMSAEGVVAIKTIHVSFGYVLAISLLLRFIWGFVGNKYARWTAIWPRGRGYMRELRDYADGMRAGRPRFFLGHNPAGRIAVVVIFLLLACQAITGLVLAGTDLFYPPFGGWIANWVAAVDADPSTLTPLSPELLDQASYASMRGFRAPVVQLHEFLFYLITAAALVHVIAVVITELREGGTIVSAMITGRKANSVPPEDI